MKDENARSAVPVRHNLSAVALPKSDGMRRVSRRRLLTGVPATVAAGSLLAGNGVESASAHDNGTERDVSNALEFVGRMIQEGGQFTGFGYVTFLREVPASLLFAPAGSPSEGSALLTIYTVATLASIARVNGVFVARATGAFGLYLRGAGGATFGDPASFRSGTLIAWSDAEYQNTLTVTDPDQGIAHVVGAFSQRQALTFLLGGHRYRIGRRGLQQRLTAVGKGVRTDSALPRASFDLGGYVTSLD